MNFWQIYNSVEIWIWVILGVVFFIAGVAKDPATRFRCWLAAVVFILFGISDAVELRTGAWWKPWWLLLWKAACVLTLLGLYIENVVIRIRNRTQSD